MTRILITGGAGFIGSNLARLAAAESTVTGVTVLDNLATGSRRNLEGVDVDFQEGDITDPAALDRAMDDVDAVVHLAAMASVPHSIDDPMACHEINATGTLKVLEASRRNGVRQVLAASSSAVYGANPAAVKNERDWVRPLSPYAVSKLATEQYLLAYQTCYDLSTMAFRFFNVYGPGQPAGHVYAAVIPIFTDALLTGRVLPVNGDGTQTRDFIYVGTVARILLDAVLRRMSHPEPVNVALGSETTLLELVSALETASGLQATIEFRPPRSGEIAQSRADDSSLRALFPDLDPVPLDRGLAETVAWTRRQLEQV
jgi:UDP-glucose 4-epimerase